jgi:hypothetical protein
VREGVREQQRRRQRRQVLFERRGGRCPGCGRRRRQRYGERRRHERFFLGDRGRHEQQLDREQQLERERQRRRSSMRRQLQRVLLSDGRVHHVLRQGEQGRRLHEGPLRLLLILAAIDSSELMRDVRYLML